MTLDVPFERFDAFFTRPSIVLGTQLQFPYSGRIQNTPIKICVHAGLDNDILIPLTWLLILMNGLETTLKLPCFSSAPSHEHVHYYI
jgi:hypothetical protein